MQKLIVFSTLFIVAFGACPNNTGSFTGPNGGCFLLSDRDDTYFAAIGACHAFQGNLTSIHNAFANNALAGTAHNATVRTFWVGGHHNGNNWAWEDGTTFDYDNWANGQPGNRPREDHIIVGADDGKWFATEERTIHRFICEVPSS